MKMTVKELMACLEEINQNIDNVNKLQAAAEWDAKDKIDDTANVNKPFNMICQTTVSQLVLLKTLLRESLDRAEVNICE